MSLVERAKERAREYAGILREFRDDLVVELGEEASEAFLPELIRELLYPVRPKGLTLREMILGMIRERPLTLNEISAYFTISQPIGHHTHSSSIICSQLYMLKKNGSIEFVDGKYRIKQNDANRQS